MLFASFLLTIQLIFTSTQYTCDNGHCNFTCPSNTTCTFQCYGDGYCNQTCEGSNCTILCDGSHCYQNCKGKYCYQDCNGSGWCTQLCSLGFCQQACIPGNCNDSCDGGGCVQVCAGPGECYRNCVGGACQQYCPGGHCNDSCDGGGCVQNCTQYGGCLRSCGNHCKQVCNGGCVDICEEGCNQTCDNDCTQVCTKGDCFTLCNISCEQVGGDRSKLDCNQNCTQICKGIGCVLNCTTGCNQTCIGGGCKFVCNDGCIQNCIGGSCSYIGWKNPKLVMYSDLIINSSTTITQSNIVIEGSLLINSMKSKFYLSSIKITNNLLVLNDSILNLQNSNFFVGGDIILYPQSTIIINTFNNITVNQCVFLDGSMVINTYQSQAFKRFPILNSKCINGSFSSVILNFTETPQCNSSLHLEYLQNILSFYFDLIENCTFKIQLWIYIVIGIVGLLLLIVIIVSSILIWRRFEEREKKLNTIGKLTRLTH